MPATRSRERFARLIGAMLAFHLAIEEEFRRYETALEDGGITMSHRYRKGALIREAAFLRSPVSSLPDVAFKDAFEAAGGVYVMEGSTLGGLAIGKEVAHHLHFRSSYYGEFGTQTATRWRNTVEQLERFAAGDERRLNGMRAGAEHTFRALHKHLSDAAASSDSP